MTSTKGWRKAQSAVMLAELLDKRKVSEVAKIEGVSTPVIYNRMEWAEYQELIARFTEELKTAAMAKVEALWNSDNPQDRRTSATLSVALLKIFTPKISNTTTQSLNYNITARQMEIKEGMKKLSPEEDEELQKMLLKVDRGQ